MRDGFDVSSDSEDKGEEDCGANDAGDLGSAAGPEVDDRAESCAGAGKSADESGDCVTDTLTDEFSIQIVASSGHRVGDERSQQVVDGAEEGDNQRGLHSIDEEVG